MNKGERISDFVASLGSGDYYAAFFHLWNKQRYYEAHDVLEQLWLTEKDAELGRFYKGLIQAAGAFVHLQRNYAEPRHPKHSRRLRPAARLFALALANVEPLPNQFRGLDLVQFRKILNHFRDRLITSEFTRNPWSPTNAPQLLIKSSR
jgi:hypothetical protein